MQVVFPDVDKFLASGPIPWDPLAQSPRPMNRLIPTMTAAAALVGLGVLLVFQI